MSETFGFDPDWTIRPGVHLAEEVEARGFRSRLAAVLCSGLSAEVFAGVLDGSVQIDAEIAVGLARLGGTARFWLALEAGYRRDLAEGRVDVSDQ